MARKELKVVIDAPGRDFGKVFILREMPASQSEKWALRAISALAASGIDIPDDIAEAGLAGVARIGVQAFGGLSWEKAEPLLDEMFQCVAFMPDPSKPQITRCPLIEDDVEEVATRLKLRKELFALHLDFSKVAADLIQAQAAANSTTG